MSSTVVKGLLDYPPTSWILCQERGERNAVSAAGTIVKDFALDLRGPARRARYVRLRIELYGPLPAWHPSAGSPTWFFADDIIVR